MPILYKQLGIFPLPGNFNIIYYIHFHVRIYWYIMFIYRSKINFVLGVVEIVHKSEMYLKNAIVQFNPAGIRLAGQGGGGARERDTYTHCVTSSVYNRPFWIFVYVVWVCVHVSVLWCDGRDSYQNTLNKLWAYRNNSCTRSDATAQACLQEKTEEGDARRKKGREN